MSPTRTTVQVQVSYLRRTVAALADYDKAAEQFRRAADDHNKLVIARPAGGWNDVTNLAARREQDRAQHAMEDRRAVALLQTRFMLGMVLASCGLSLEQLVNAHNDGELETLLTASLSQTAQAAE